MTVSYFYLINKMMTLQWLIHADFDPTVVYPIRDPSFFDKNPYLETRVKYSFCFEFSPGLEKMQNQNGKRPMESNSERQNQQKIRKLGQQRKTAFKLSKSFLFKFEWSMDVDLPVRAA